MARQSLLPGIGFVNGTDRGQSVLPGVGFIDDTGAIALLVSDVAIPIAVQADTLGTSDVVIAPLVESSALAYSAPLLGGRQSVIPGIGFVNENSGRQSLLPGVGFVNDNSTAGSLGGATVALALPVQSASIVYTAPAGTLGVFSVAHAAAVQSSLPSPSYELAPADVVMVSDVETVATSPPVARPYRSPRLGVGLEAPWGFVMRRYGSTGA